jgi:hypothetical protein
MSRAPVAQSYLNNDVDDGLTIRQKEMPAGIKPVLIVKVTDSLPYSESHVPSPIGVNSHPLAVSSSGTSQPALGVLGYH